MKLNPITALSDSLSKLVIEHGSAVITEKNLAFLRDQLAAAEKEISVLTTALEKCKTEKQNLKTQLQNSKNENKGLKKKIETHEKSTHKDLLAEEQVSMLKCLALLPPDNGLPFDPIMTECKLSYHATQFHLEELENKYFIESIDINNVPHWFLEHEGLGYLIKHKLLL